MSDSYNIGSAVKWKWGAGWGRGKVIERFTDKVTREISGTDVTRSAGEENPAYLIEQSDGGRVLKSHAELEKDE